MGFFGAIVGFSECFSGGFGVSEAFFSDFRGGSLVFGTVFGRCSVFRRGLLGGFPVFGAVFGLWGAVFGDVGCPGVIEFSVVFEFSGHFGVILCLFILSF